MGRTRRIRRIRARESVAVIAMALVASVGFAARSGSAGHSPELADAPFAAEAAVAAAPEGALPGWGIVVPDDAARVRLVPAAEGNEARYRVREQLASISFPSDAVGSTQSVTGALVLDENGNVVRDGSRFEVDLSQIRSDNGRRDNYVRRNTLRTAEHPKAIFVPTAVRGLSGGLPGENETSFELVGDLTVNGVTRPITWNVTARGTGDAVRGTASTRFTFETFEMRIPRVVAVLSVENDIRLEYDFNLTVSTE